MSAEETMFQNVLAAVERGERSRGRDLLTRLLKTNPANPQYWLWMSALVDSRRERSFCLKEALRLDPKSKAARYGLIMLGELPPEKNLAVPLELQQRNWQAHFTTGAQAKNRFFPLASQAIVLAGGVLIILALLAAGIFGLGRLPLPAFFARPSATAGLPAGQFPAQTATLPGPTPLAHFLSAAYTATPLYVNTPHTRSEDYRNALLALQRGDFDAMLEYLDKAAQLDAQAADIQYYRGEAYRLQGKTGQAFQAYQQALRLNAGFAPALLGRARLHLASAPPNRADARADLQAAISLDPGLAEAYLELAVLDLAQGQGAAALQRLEKAAGLLPASPLVYLYQAQAHLLMEQPGLAIEAARRANRLDFTLLPVYRVLGEAYRATGETEGALAALQTYTLYEPGDAQALVWLSLVYAERQETELALRSFEEALQQDSRQYEAYLQRGLIYLAQDKDEEARRDLEKAVSLQPRSYLTLLSLGQVYLRLGRNGSAYQQLSRAEAFAESETERGQVYYWRAQALEKLGENNAAARDWQALLSLSGESVPPEWRSEAQQQLERLATPTHTLPALSPTSTRQPTRTAIPTSTRRPTLTFTSTATPRPSATGAQTLTTGAVQATP